MLLSSFAIIITKQLTLSVVTIRFVISALLWSIVTMRLETRRLKSWTNARTHAQVTLYSVQWTYN